MSRYFNRSARCSGREYIAGRLMQGCSKEPALDRNYSFVKSWVHGRACERCVQTIPSRARRQTSAQNRSLQTIPPCQARATPIAPLAGNIRPHRPLCLTRLLFDVTTYGLRFDDSGSMRKYFGAGVRGKDVRQSEQSGLHTRLNMEQWFTQRGVNVA